MIELRTYQTVQSIAKSVHASLANLVSSESTEASIVEQSRALLCAYGVSETWYHDCPALVLLGSRSKISISGRSYKPAHEEVGDENLVTIDLSPIIEGAWGDCARSIPVEDGKACQPGKSEIFGEGMAFELLLHEKMKQFVRPDTSFEELHEFSTREIVLHGYENLDFGGNLGHSIVTRLDDRCYLEKGCKVKLGEVRFFTFEPHIAKVGSNWGFKHENIYYFDEHEQLREL
jgi:Xaa-Pro aminopeptidase